MTFPLVVLIVSGFAVVIGVETGVWGIAALAMVCMVWSGWVLMDGQP